MSFIQKLEDEAEAQLEAIRADRLSGNRDGDLRIRAKTALGVIGAYVRLRATMANEKSNELIERRLGLETPPPRPLPPPRIEDESDGDEPTAAM